MYRIWFLLFLTTAFLASSCKDTNSGQSQETQIDAIDTVAVSTDPQAPVSVYAWVDNLRLREKPDTKSKIISELKEGEELWYLNEKSDFKERINLRGQLFNEPWLKVQTANKQTGWIYGGGVKFYKPDVDANPSPYESCIALYNDKKLIQSEACYKSTQQAQLKKDQQYVAQNEEGIIFHLLSGKEIKLLHDYEEGIETEAPPHTYDYRYYIPQMGYFVVQLHTLEKGGYLLVNDKSGKQIGLWGYPKPSPDFKYLLSYHGDLESGFEANGLQIFGFGSNGLEKIWERELKDYEPVSARWLDNTTAEIQLNPASFDKNSRPRKVNLFLNGSGEWEFEL